MSIYYPFPPVTDESCRMRKIIALEGMEMFATGSNQPMVILGIDESDGVKGEFVVKFKAGGRMTDPSAALREICGAYIAREIGLDVVEPVQIIVSEPFTQSMIGHALWAVCTASMGNNYGSRYVAKMPSLKPADCLTETQLHIGKKIFAFDAMIMNFDRSNAKPNMLTDGEKIVLIDHEVAFAFTMALPWVLPNAQPWILDKADREKMKQHYFWPHLVGRNVTFSEFNDDFASLNEVFWRNLRSRIPPEWSTNQIDRIQPYISEIVNHRAEFFDDLRL